MATFYRAYIKAATDSSDAVIAAEQTDFFFQNDTDAETVLGDKFYDLDTSDSKTLGA
jgi:hypothetical protein